MKIVVDGIQFNFPENFKCVKYDEMSFYKNQFQKIAKGQKAVDVIASNNGVMWFVEVKDYRKNQRTKAIELALEVALKVQNSLAGILAASINAFNEEKQLAKNILPTKKIKVALQLEQPKKHSKLFPRAINKSYVLQKLKKMIKAIDPHPIVNESINKKPSVPWESQCTS